MESQERKHTIPSQSLSLLVLVSHLYFPVDICFFLASLQISFLSFCMHAVDTMNPTVQNLHAVTETN